ncbi:MAG TPA: crossover junction endodeoxyribonuclease RuvC, partial [Spirochaetota bacterium]|nr:crossover junction endodeoxyribonuclease RuvC [Spirochaetota bacterium]
EYTPREIKKAVSGNGNAPKQTVQLMIGKILNLSKIIEPDDAADSVAAAVCLSNELEKAKCMNI